MVDINAAIAAARQSAEEGKKAADEAETADRSFIAKLIAWAFIILIGFIVVVVTIGTVYPGWDKVSEPIKVLLTILNSVMLPVVTLVFGYYFGKKT